MESSVRLFASVDLVGSTAFKNKFTSDALNYASGTPPWSEVFRAFYHKFSSLINESEGKFKSGSLIKDKRNRFVLLKGIGDELVYSQEIKHHDEAIELTVIFRDSLRKYNELLKKEDCPLRVKGTLWLAGFPINNTKIPNPAPPDAGSAQPEYDYLGPSIDTGFRISKFSTIRKMVVSIDLALLLTCSTDTGLVFYFDGVESLKGVLNEKPYPIVWVECDEDRTIEELQGIKKEPCREGNLQAFCKKFIADHQEQSWLIRAIP